MRKIQILAASAVLFAVPGLASALYSTSFDNASVAGDFNVVSVSATSGDVVTFGYDYSANGIAEATNTAGGAAATRGLFMQTNKGASGVINGINAYLTAGGVSSHVGEIRVQFDMWLNVAGTTGSTEQALFGINTDGAGTNTRTGSTQTGADGAWFHWAGEGGYGNTSSTPNSRDFVGYVDNTVNARFDNGEEPFFSLLPNGPLAGTPGNQWVTVVLEEAGGNVNMSVNGTQVASFANTGAADGSLFLGYQDPFSGSIGDIGVFAVYDNLSVEAVPEPATMSVLALGALAAAARRRRKS